MSEIQSSVTTLQYIIFSIDTEFASVGPKLAKNLPPVKRPYFDFLTQTKLPESSFVHNPVNPEDVKLEITCIPINESHGLYSCPPQLLECS